MNSKTKQDKGTYCLIINVSKNSRIKIGAKGIIAFKMGYYVYVGSALNNLSKRITRHMSKDKKKHWHMDYLSMNKNVEIKQAIYINSLKKVECELSSYINNISLDYIDGFGCSDCDCNSHLYYFNSYDDAISGCVDAFESMKLNPKKWV